MNDLHDMPRSSLDLLRQLTDRHVIDQLIVTSALTRAEIASRTGISKPTISESVRRLEQAGVIGETGQLVSSRRGRPGVNYELRGDIGVALAVSVGPDGLIAETLDVRGRQLARSEVNMTNSVISAQLDSLLLGIVSEAARSAPAPVRATALSIAAPIDRESGQLIHLPHAPFLVEKLNPRRLLEGVISGELIIDNDVNWAAVAEYEHGVAADFEDFCYLYLGPGVGGAVVRNGTPVRGRSGLAGELAHIITKGPHGKAMPLVECFRSLGLVKSGSASIDVIKVRHVMDGTTIACGPTGDAIVEALSGVIVSIVAMLDPAGIVVGGPWSSAGDLVKRLNLRVATAAVAPTEVRHARLDSTASLAGARLAAIRATQRTLLGPLAKELKG